MKAFGWLLLRINCDNGTMPKTQIIKKKQELLWLHGEFIISVTINESTCCNNLSYFFMYLGCCHTNMFNI